MTHFYEYPTQYPRIAAHFDPPWWAIQALWLGFIVAVFALATVDPAGYGLAAYDVYHEGAARLLDGTPLYSGTSGWIYLYPPFMAQILTPAALLFNVANAGLLWLGLNIGLLVVSVALLARHLPAQWVKPLWVGAVLFVPIGQALYIGQVTVVMLALLVGAWFAIRAEQRGLAGALVAVAAWIKVFPGILLLYFLWKRDWRVVRGVVVAGLVILAAQVVISGPAMMIDFFRTLLELTATGQPGVTHENNSILAFASRLFEDNPNVQHLVISPYLFNLTRQVLTFGVIGITLVAVVRSGGSTEHPDWRFDLEFSLVVLTILLMGGTLWISGMPPLLMMYAFVMRSLRRYPRPGLILGLLAVSFLLIVTFIPVMMLFLSPNTPALLLSTGFFGVMILWGVLVALLLRKEN